MMCKPMFNCVNNNLQAHVSMKILSYFLKHTRFEITFFQLKKEREREHWLWLNFVRKNKKILSKIIKEKNTTIKRLQTKCI